MIATGIGLNAVRAGYRVLFVNAKDLADRLYEKMQEGTLREVLDDLNKVPLLIVDELSYIKMDRERESLFFQPANGQMGRAVHRQACSHGNPGPSGTSLPYPEYNG